MAEKIINPSPARSEVKDSEESTKLLLKKLRKIDNFCESFKDANKLQESLSNDGQIISLLSQFNLVSICIKFLIKSNIDDDYIEIKNRTQNLKQAMEKTYSNIDLVCTNFSNNCTKAIFYLQKNDSSEKNPSTTSQVSILNEMTKTTDKLPSC